MQIFYRTRFTTTPSVSTYSLSLSSLNSSRWPQIPVPMALRVSSVKLICVIMPSCVNPSNIPYAQSHCRLLLSVTDTLIPSKRDFGINSSARMFYRELTILKAPNTATFVVAGETTAGHVNASNALSLGNLLPELSPVSISICDIGDDDDAFSRSNNCRSSSRVVVAGEGTPFSR